VFLNDKQIVRNLYTINNADKLLVDIGKIVSEDLKGKAEELTRERKINQDRIYRNGLAKKAVQSFRPVLSTVLSKSLYRHLSAATRDYLYRPRNEVRLEPFESDYVKDFIQWFYTDDIALYERVKQNAARP